MVAYCFSVCWFLTYILPQSLWPLVLMVWFTNSLTDGVTVTEDVLTESKRDRDATPVEELIERMESDKVEGMDDRMSDSSEDSMIIKDEPKGTQPAY